MRFKPYFECDGVPNIVVDGTPHKDSNLVLSHWIDSGTDPKWMRDTSTEIVLDFIEEHGVPKDIEYVTNDHYDQDGLLGIYALLEPSYSLKNRDLFVEIAEAGDFGKYKDRKAVRISIAIASMLNPKFEFISSDTLEKPHPELTGIFYKNGIEMIPRLVEDIDAFKYLWEEEDQFLSESEELISNKTISIVEDLDNDIAIVTIPTNIKSKHFHRFSMDRKWPVHDIAIHNATKRGRVFYIYGAKFQFKFKYETWVQLQENIHPLRVDLSSVAKKLNEMDHVEWKYEGSHNLIPSLLIKEDKESTLDYSEVLELIRSELNYGEVNWNPYR